MKVKELYEECAKLISENLGNFDVTIEMENSKNSRELIRGSYTIQFGNQRLSTPGLFVLKTDHYLDWK